MKDNKLVIIIDYNNGVDEEGIEFLKKYISDWGNEDIGGWFDGDLDFWCNQKLEQK